MILLFEWRKYNNIGNERVTLTRRKEKIFQFISNKEGKKVVHRNLFINDV